ncbi:MAG: alpha-amylase, partial [Chitinophagaceae bacterium]
REDRYPITDIFDQTPEIPETCQWAIFLRNHDELTLEMVTDEERDYMYKVYAKDPKAKINLGIRHRLAPLMENDRRRIELMNSLLFSLPGTPVIYYGDEIGMGDNFYLGDRDGVRTPMQWSPDRNAGFSDTNPQRLYLPVILDPQYHYESVNVETQRGNTSSLFWFMKRIINMRKKFKAFSRGDMQFIHVENPKVLAFTRSYEDETLLIIANLSKYAQPAEMDLKEFNGYVPVEVFSRNPFPSIKETSPYFFTLAPHSYQWFVLKKQHAEKKTETRYAKLAVEQWEGLFQNEAADVLQSLVLPDYIQRMPWFTGKGKSIHSVSLLAHTPIPLVTKDAEILLIEVSFESGLPEYYQLPVVFLNDEEERDLSGKHPSAIIAQVKLGNENGYLCDAAYVEVFHFTLLQFMVRSKRFMGSGEVIFMAEEEVQRFLQTETELGSRVHATSELQTAIVFNNRFFLKLYRRIDKGLHPDVELTNFLTVAAQGSTTTYAGAIKWRLDNSVFYLAMLEKLEENHGDGHQYMLDRINNYLERILARKRSVISGYPTLGSLVKPVAFDELNDELKEFIGGNGAELARQIGIRLAEIHKALAASIDKDLAPEEFSLHYQRSLFSSMTSLVRETVQVVQGKVDQVPAAYRGEVKAIADKREVILNKLKKIYAKKFDIQKLRTHGNLGLSHVLLTGRDVIIHDFGGNPLKPYSERRLKRSPLRDVAAMVRSFYYVAYEGFFVSPQMPGDEQQELLPFASFWAHYMSNFFMRAYLEETKDAAFIPQEKEDFEILLQTFLLENALHWFNYELTLRPERVVIPLRIIQMIMPSQEREPE